MSGVTTATIIAGVTAAAAVAGTAYTIMSSGSRSSGGGGQQMAPQPVQMPATPAPIAAPAPVPTPEPEAPPEKETAPKLKAEAPDPARGVAGTMLTGGLGDTSDAKTKKKTLLGS